MASFAQRLAKAQSSLPPPEEESIEHMTMEDLKGELMTFGKAHIGKPYEEIWANHPDWVRWFAAHFRWLTDLTPGFGGITIFALGSSASKKS